MHICVLAGTRAHSCTYTHTCTHILHGREADKGSSHPDIHSQAAHVMADKDRLLADPGGQAYTVAVWTFWE